MTGAILKLYKPPSVEEWQLLFGKLLPGAHVAAIASGGCPYHRMTVNLEDAGSQIRDQIVWIGETTIPIALAGKPLGTSSITADVLKYGTGAINVDECRISTFDNLGGGAYSNGGRTPYQGVYSGDTRTGAALGMFLPGSKPNRGYLQPKGRFPANVILTREATSRLASRFFKCCDTEQELIACLRLLITPPEVKCLNKN